MIAFFVLLFFQFSLILHIISFLRASCKTKLKASLLRNDHRKRISANLIYCNVQVLRKSWILPNSQYVSDVIFSNFFSIYCFFSLKINTTKTTTIQTMPYGYNLTGMNTNLKYTHQRVFMYSLLWKYLTVDFFIT